MQAVIEMQDMCVLATVSGDSPHCSLMAYITDEEYRKLFMITHKTTKKYANLLANPSVCLLIDTRRMTDPVPRKKVQALTVNGTFEHVNEERERDEIRRKFVEKHVHLKDFAFHGDAVVFAVRLESLQLLRGATDASYQDLR